VAVVLQMAGLCWLIASAGINMQPGTSANVEPLASWNIEALVGGRGSVEQSTIEVGEKS